MNIQNTDENKDNGVTVEITGGDSITVGLVASAVNYGLSECGFENVTIAVPEDITCHPADENLAAIMRQAKEQNPEPFMTEVDVVMSFGDDDEPELGDAPPPSRGFGEDEELEVEPD